MKIFQIIVAQNDGVKNWRGGAYCYAFVYSNKGNILVKGYYAEVSRYVKKLKEKGYKYFVNYTLFFTDYILKYGDKKLKLESHKQATKIQQQLDENPQKAELVDLEKIPTKRNFWETSNKNVQIFSPRNYKRRGAFYKTRYRDYYDGVIDQKKYTIVKTNFEDSENICTFVKSFRRMPNRWLHEFNEIF